MNQPEAQHFRRSSEVTLERHIERVFPEGLSYQDAAQLCLRLYSSVDGVPARLHSECSKDGLAETFARLAQRGLVNTPALEAALYGANFHAVQEKGHWVEVIASIFKKGGTVDAQAGARLAARLTDRG